ncbi:MAG: hypothetical protein WCI63_04055 [bacterium]
MNPNTKNAEKRKPKHICVVCDFSTSKKSEYDRHLLTSKHERLTNPNKKTPKIQTDYTCECGRKYKHMSSLCTHKKTCCGEKINENDKEDRSLEFIGLLKVATLVRII